MTKKLFKNYGALIGIALLAYVLLIWAPGSMSAFRLSNLGKYCALALAAMGIGLAWDAVACSSWGRACSSASAVM